MKARLLLLLLIPGYLYSCKKDNDPTPETPDSTWSINQDTFSCKKTELPSLISTGCNMSASDTSKGGSKAFINITADTLNRTTDSFLITNMNLWGNSTLANIDIEYKSTNYKACDSRAIDKYCFKKTINNKTQITIPPTWFKRYRLAGTDNGGCAYEFINSDSVLVQGVFYQP